MLFRSCRNDLEFGVVRWSVGIGGQWGPYEEDGEYGMDLDDEDDSD